MSPASITITPALLRAALALPRPGGIRRDAIGRRNAQPAAVLLPIVLGPEPVLLAVVRSRTMRDHAGEVGFPGGKIDPGDSSLLDTALRETEEELGIPAASIEHLGELAPIPVITGKYLIHPFVGLAPGGVLSPSTAEVERVIALPIAPWLTGEMTIRAVAMGFADAATEVPHFEVDGSVLYGASACIFHELLARIAAALWRTLPPSRLQSELPWAERYDS